MRGWITSVILVLLILAIFTPIVGSSNSANSQSLELEIKKTESYTNPKVLFDESHCDRGSDMWTPGNASVLGALLEAHNYTTSTNWEESLYSDILSGYDVLCLVFPQLELSASEIAAVHSFVDSGGGLLLVGVGQSPDFAYTVEYLNPISEEYGITFNDDKWLGKCLSSNGDLLTHPINYDVASVHSSCDQLRGCTLEVSTPSSEIAYYEDSPVVACCESGNGRVVSAGMLAPFIQYRHDSNWRIDWDDHYQFSLNVFDWLARTTERKVEVPDKFYIRIGDGPDLTPSEIAEYQAFGGVYHDHTTRSDGQDSPETMVNRALETSLDYFVISDHSYKTSAKNGILGALDGREHQRKYGLDCQIFIGAELSSIPHTAGFPLHENIFTDDIPYAIDKIHEQDALAILAHPTIGFSYIDPWVNFDIYGYDAFEVDNRNYFHALGESCYFRPFIGANDGHAEGNLALVQNIVFVKSPTGPNGEISVEDLMDAILDYRVVVLDLVNMVILGQGIWVDRVIELWNLAEDAIENASVQLQTIEEGGVGVEYSKLYLEAARNALDWWNPSKAIRLATESISSYNLGLDFILSAPDFGVVEPEDSIPFNVTIVNRNTYPVTFNISIFETWAITSNSEYRVVEVPANGNTTLAVSFFTALFGYAKMTFNIRSYNSSGIHIPLTYTVGGIIRCIEVSSSNYEMTIQLMRNRFDYRMIKSTILHYDAGDGETILPMENYGDSYGLVLGPYPENTAISFFIVVTDELGNNYTLDGGTHQVLLGTTGTSNTGNMGDVVISAVLGGAAILVLVLVLFVAKRRKST